MNPSINYMPPQQFEQLLTAIPRLKIRRWQGGDVIMLFKICYWCGLRISEGCKLEKESFDTEFRQVYLGITKTNKGDHATIPEKFIPELQAYLLQKGTGRLFPGMNRYITYNWLKRLGVMLEIKALTTPQSETGEKTVTHIFRKSVGKDMLYGTFGPRQPLNIVQQKLRHTNPLMTTKYLKATDEDVRQAGW